MIKQYRPLIPSLLTLTFIISASINMVNASTSERTAQSQQNAVNKFLADNAYLTDNAKSLNLSSFEKSKQYQEWATSLGKQAMEQIKPQNPEADAAGVMIFASLGMPETALKQLMQQASDFNVPVVIRGLWQNDFAATVKKVQSLILSDSGETMLGGVEINPVWFKQFNIQQVPAFVAIGKGLCINEPPCDPKSYDIVYGNVSLYNALETIANKGAFPEIAQNLLSSR